MLDALLAYIVLSEKGVKKTPAELSPENLLFAELPIERIEKCYLCSAAIYPAARYIKSDSFAKRGTPNAHMSNIMPTFLSTLHVAKPGLLRGIELAVPYIDFYARVTDQEYFINLLKVVKQNGIGKKTSIGFGQIAGINVFKSTHPNRCYKTEAGLPTRPLPVRLFQDKIDEDTATVGMSGYYAPYWFRKNHVPCFLPDTSLMSPLPELNGNMISDMKAELATKTSQQ